MHSASLVLTERALTFLANTEVVIVRAFGAIAQTEEPFARPDAHELVHVRQVVILVRHDISNPEMSSPALIIATKTSRGTFCLPVLGLCEIGALSAGRAFRGSRSAAFISGT